MMLISVKSADICQPLSIREHFQLKVIANVRQIKQLPSKKSADRQRDQTKWLDVVGGWFLSL